MTSKHIRLRSPGLAKQVSGVLTNDWQTTAIIACQVYVAPDVIARMKANKKSRYNYNQTDATAKTDLLARVLAQLAQGGIAEKRRVSSNKNEYRLAQQADAKH